MNIHECPNSKGAQCILLSAIPRMISVASVRMDELRMIVLGISTDLRDQYLFLELLHK